MNLPQRKNIRLTGYDYSQAGYYFITVCTHNRRNLFGEIVDGAMVLSRFGKIVENDIIEIPKHIDHIVIDKFIVMPNHAHMILIVLPSNVGTPYMVSANQDNHNMRTPYMASLQEKSKQIVPKTIQQLKASVSRQTKTVGLWQSRYYDHIIRNEQEYHEIWKYIDTNPLKWEIDKYYKE